MNIELEIKDIKHDLNYAKKCEYDHVTLDVYKVQALLTAYEKEKEDKKLIDKNRKEIFEKYEKEKDISHYNQSQLDIANAKLIEQGREEVRDKIKANKIVATTKSEILQRIKKWGDK